MVKVGDKYISNNIKHMDQNPKPRIITEIGLAYVHIRHDKENGIQWRIPMGYFKLNYKLVKKQENYTLW